MHNYYGFQQDVCRISNFMSQMLSNNIDAMEHTHTRTHGYKWKWFTVITEKRATIKLLMDKSGNSKYRSIYF